MAEGAVKVVFGDDPRDAHKEENTIWESFELPPFESKTLSPEQQKEQFNQAAADFGSLLGGQFPNVADQVQAAKTMVDDIKNDARKTLSAYLQKTAVSTITAHLLKKK